MIPKCAPTLNPRFEATDEGKEVNHSSRACAEPNRAFRRSRCIVLRGCRQTEQDHGAVTQEARDYSTASDRFPINQGMKVL